MSVISGGGSSSGSGAITQIGGSVAAATAASFAFSGIGQTFNHLWIVANVHCDQPAGAGVINLKLNNDSTAAYDIDNGIFTSAASVTVTAVAAATAARIGAVPGTAQTVQATGLVSIVIPNYTGTTFYKTWVGTGGRKDLDNISNFVNEVPWGSWRNVAAVTAVTVLAAGTSGTAANFVPGSSCFIYGLT